MTYYFNVYGHYMQYIRLTKS